MKHKEYSKEAGELLTSEEAMARYRLGRHTVEKLAADCGASLKIGKLRRYRRSILDEYINTFEG